VNAEKQIHVWHCEPHLPAELRTCRHCYGELEFLPTKIAETAAPHFACRGCGVVYFLIGQALTVCEDPDSHGGLKLEVRGSKRVRASEEARQKKKTKRTKAKAAA
jgi:hypothetical protein